MGILFMAKTKRVGEVCKSIQFPYFCNPKSNLVSVHHAALRDGRVHLNVMFIAFF